MKDLDRSVRLCVYEHFARSGSRYRDRLEPDWSPKTTEVMRAIFDEADLTGEFWDVR